MKFPSMPGSRSRAAAPKRISISIPDLLEPYTEHIKYCVGNESEGVDSTKVWAFQKSANIWTLATLAPVTSKSKKPAAGHIAVIFASSPRDVVDVPTGDTHLFDPSHAVDNNDATTLNNLHESPLLYLLLSRYNRSQIFTNASEVLISVNPYKEIKNLFSDETMNSFLNCVYGTDKTIDSQPHIYNTARKAYHMLMYSDTDDFDDITSSTSRKRDKAGVIKNQSCVVSGESGAGKTEACKTLLRYLIYASFKRKSELEGEGKTKTKALTADSNNTLNLLGLGETLIKSNTILESFGNAQTILNTNSSRFGKYIKLLYDPDTHLLLGSRTESFLLEKTRITNVEYGERGYHVFYQIVKGVRSIDSLKPIADTLGIDAGDTNCMNFTMLTLGSVTSINNVDDIADFRGLLTALEGIDVSQEEINELVKLIVSVLHLGNIVFTDNDKTDMSEMKLTSKNFTLAKLAGLMGLSEDNLKIALLKKQTRSGRGSVVSMDLNAVNAKAGADAFIKFVYGQCFNWLVKKINQANDVKNAANTSTSTTPNNFIGILDIFGFELLPNNTLSQLLINYANEKLHEQFTQHIITLEKHIYAVEGVELPANFDLKFEENSTVCELIDRKKTGILSIIESHNILGREIKTAEMLSSLERVHGGGKHSKYEKSRFFSSEQFVIKHFAGPVSYKCEGLVGKNNDSLQDDLKMLLGSSTNVFVLNVCTEGVYSKGAGTAGYTEDDATDDQFQYDTSLPPPPQSGSNNAPSNIAALTTISSIFRTQLTNLVSTLHTTESHYIKCIRPNNSKASTHANVPLVLEQLRYSGVLEVVRIRREGFPLRLSFAEFYKQFEVLVKDEGHKKASQASVEEAMLAGINLCEIHLKRSEWAKGNTKIFLTPGTQEKLADKAHKIFSKMVTRLAARTKMKIEVRKLVVVKFCIILLQKVARMRRTKQEFEFTKSSTVKAQSLLRKRVAMFNLRNAVRCATKIASISRKRKAMFVLEANKAAVTKVSAVARRRKARQDFIRGKSGLVTVQAFERRRKLKKAFLLKKKTAIMVESIFRGHVEKVKFKIAKRAAAAIQAVARKNIAVDIYQTQKKAALLLHKQARRFKSIAKLERIKQGIFIGQKRRNNSITTHSQGDYIGANLNNTIYDLLKKFNKKEDSVPTIRFACDVEKYNRKGKCQMRQIIVTNSYAYMLDNTKVNSCYHIGGGEILGFSLSTMADDFVFIHLKKDRDVVLTCAHKTELVTVVNETEMKTGALPLLCTDTVKFRTYGSGFSRLAGLTTISAEFVEDLSVTPSDRWSLLMAKDAKSFVIKVSSAFCTDARQGIKATWWTEKFDILTQANGKKKKGDQVKFERSEKMKGLKVAIGAGKLGLLGRSLSTMSIQSESSASFDSD